MGSNRYFWPQDLLDEWVVAEKIVIENNLLTVHDLKKTFKIEQAVYFASDVGDGSDAHRLVGRVKEVTALQAMGAEYYMDSVLMGDSAYLVVPGFAGLPAFAGDKEEAGDISGALSAETGEQEEAEDKELLARFLLENL